MISLALVAWSWFKMSDVSATHTGWCWWAKVNMVIPENDDDDCMWWAHSWIWEVPLAAAMLFQWLGHVIARFINPDCEPYYNFWNVVPVDEADS